MKRLSNEQIYSAIKKGPANASIISSLLSQLGCYNGLLNFTNKLPIEKRIIIYEYYIEFLFTKFDINSSFGIKENNNINKILLFRISVRQNKPIFQSYQILNTVKDPSKYLKKEEIKWVIDTYGPDVILNDFGESFIEGLIYYANYYLPIIIKYKDDKEILNFVFSKLVEENNESKYKYVYDGLKQIGLENLMLNFTKQFIMHNCNNEFIASDIIKFKCYSRNKFNYLVDVVINSNNPFLIYELLMDDTLKWCRVRFLNALFNIGDTEYVSYYYFFKESDKFNQIYGDKTSFLAYVYCNPKLFNNKYILNKIIKKIFIECDTFVDNPKKDLKRIRH